MVSRFLVFLLAFVAIDSFVSRRASAKVNFMRNALGQEIAWKGQVRWVFDCEFPEHRKESVRNAFRYWNDLAGWEVLAEQSNTCGPLSIADGGIFVQEATSFFVNAGRAQTKTWGTTNVHRRWTRLDAATITLYRIWTLEDNDFISTSVIRHEIGHALGFDHVASEWSLMYPYIGTDAPYDTRFKDATPDEIKKFREHYGVRK